MNINMQKEFKNIEYYLKNDFLIDNITEDHDMNEFWRELLKMYLITINEMIVLAGLLEDNKLTSEQNIEASNTLNSVFAGYLQVFPDKAFIEN